MSDTDRVLEYLERHGSVTSFEIRVKGLSGNPSQRITELADRGYQIATERIRHNGRPCCRYTLAGLAGEQGGRPLPTMPPEQADTGGGRQGLPSDPPALFDLEPEDEPDRRFGHEDIDQRKVA